MRRRYNLRAIAVATTVLTLVGTATLVAGALAGWQFGYPADRLTVASVAIGLAAYAVVFVGSLVALLAYLAATGRPDLHVEVCFRFSEPNEPVFESEPDDMLGYLRVLSYRQTESRIVLTNHSPYTARNPGVRIDLVNCGNIRVAAGWEAVAWANQVGPIALQWDGGADRMVHGRWARVLPGVNMDGLTQFQSERDAELVVTVVADGAEPRVTRMPVRFLRRAAYEQYTNDRNRKYEALRAAGSTP